MSGKNNNNQKKKRGMYRTDLRNRCLRIVMISMPIENLKHNKMLDSLSLGQAWQNGSALAA